MFRLSKNAATSPLVLIHAGAGSSGKRSAEMKRGQEEVERIIMKAWPKIRKGQNAVDATSAIVKELESSPGLNAGFGSYVQQDGLARLSASLMDGKKQKFSGVHLATHIIHPSVLAAELQNREESVLGPLGAQLLARELGIAPQNPLSPDLTQAWARDFKKKSSSTKGHGTVGAVVCDSKGNLAAATSTGGTWSSSPERISDSATVSGNYASKYAAISCTGIGEQITDHGLAVRLETRVRDGMSIIEASELAFGEALKLKHKYGWIALDNQGNWTMNCSDVYMACAAISKDEQTLFRP